MPIELARRVVDGDRLLRFVVALPGLAAAGIGWRDCGFGNGTARNDARVVPGVRHHPDFGLRYLGVSLDPVDERSPARSGREQTFEHNQPGPLLEDRLERLNRFRVGKSEEFPLIGQTFRERRRQVEGCDDHCGRRHHVSLPCSRDRPFL